MPRLSPTTEFRVSYANSTIIIKAFLTHSWQWTVLFAHDKSQSISLLGIYKEKLTFHKILAPS